MVSQNNSEQRLLVNKRTSSDNLRQDQATTYDTFNPEARPKQPDESNSNSTAAGDNDPEYTWRAIFMTMSTWIGIFLASVDYSLMATLTSPISESFSAFHLLTWFINGYTIAGALIQPLSGKLSDLYGRRNCLLWSNFAFLLGNLICGLSTKSWHFILGRVIAGLGGGCMHSIATFLASDVIPPRSRGLWQGISNIAFAAGFGIGGTIGGVINDAFGWKWAFLSQPIPILVSMVLVFALVPKSTTGDDYQAPSIKQIDFLGSLTLTLAILTLMFGAVSGGNTFPWSSPFVIAPLVLSPILFAVFWYIEDKIAKDPVIPVRLLLNRSVLGCCLTNFLSMMGNINMIYYLPMILETKGLSTTQAGLRIAPNAFGAFIGSAGAGAVMNATGRYYWVCLAGHGCLLGAGLVALLTLEHITGWLSYVVPGVNGIGIGTMLVTTLLGLISAADHKKHSVLTSASYAFRTAGQTLGTTIAGAIFQNLFNHQLRVRLGHEQDAALLIPAIRRRQVELGNLPASWRQQIMESYDIAFHAVFAFVLATYVLATIAASVIREHQLHKKIIR